MKHVNERWAFRVEPAADTAVRQAAKSTHRTLTEFVVDAAVVEAERVLADRTQFLLSAEQWKRFIQVLDRPARANLGLKKLFSRPTVFTAE